jgi:hypothetical protein
LTATAGDGEVDGQVVVEAWTDDGYEVEAETGIGYFGEPAVDGLLLLP